MKKLPTKSGVYVNKLINGEVYYLEVIKRELSKDTTYNWYWSIIHGDTIPVPIDEIDRIKGDLVLVWKYQSIRTWFAWKRYRLSKAYRSRIKGRKSYV